MCECVSVCVCFCCLRAHFSLFIVFLSDSHHAHSYHFPEGTKFLIYFHLRYVASPFEIAMTCITSFTHGVLHDISVDCCTSVNEVVQ